MKETPETRAKLADAIRVLQSRGDSARIDSLVSAYKAKYREGKTTTLPVNPMNPIQKYGMDTVKRAGESIYGAGQEIAANAEKYAGGGAKNLALNVAHDVGSMSKGVFGAITSPATQAVETTMEAVTPFIERYSGNSKTAQAFATNPAFNAVADVASRVGEGVSKWSKENPEKAKLGSDVVNLTSLLSMGLLKSPKVSEINPIRATKEVGGILGSDVKAAGSAVQDVVVGAKGKVLSTVDDFGTAIKRPDVTDATAISLNPKKAGAIADTQVSVGGKLKKLSDVTPDEYAQMQESTDKALKNFTKEAEIYKNNRNPLNDPTEIVGQRVDKALGSADGKRKAIGAKMGEIEAKYVNKSLPIGEKPYQKFTETIKSFDSKYGVDTADAKVVQKLVSDFDNLQKGGATFGERMDFIRSWDRYLNDAKDAFGKFKENATANTRIQNAVMSLKEETVGAISAQDKVYRGLRGQYALYKKLDEIGDMLLGKDGMLGDRIKGGATVKRAIMSNSDAGARQFLIKLKELTGYDAIKDADLALTAMKNVGDYQGLSLLQVLNEGKSGLVRRTLEFGQDALVGDNKKRIADFVSANPVKLPKKP